MRPPFRLIARLLAAGLLAGTLLGLRSSSSRYGEANERRGNKTWPLWL